MKKHQSKKTTLKLVTYKGLTKTGEVVRKIEVEEAGLLPFLPLKKTAMNMLETMENIKTVVVESHWQISTWCREGLYVDNVAHVDIYTHKDFNLQEKE